MILTPCLLLLSVYVERQPGSQGRMEGHAGGRETNHRQLVQERNEDEGVTQRQTQLHRPHRRGTV